MKITGVKKLVTRAIFAAQVIGLHNTTILMTWADAEDCSSCESYSDGTYIVYIEQDVPKNRLIRHIAHELIHVKQYKSDRLVANEHGFWWEGRYFPPYKSEYSDEYWLSPWEIEARGYEDFVHWKWRNR